MKRIFFSSLVFTSLVTSLQVEAQSLSSRLTKAYAEFISDPQLKNAIASLYVIDAVTGKPVFDKNSTIGLAPASTQKIITAAAAYDILGPEFRYHTRLGYFGQVNNGRLNGSIVVKGTGDPTLGSWRWPYNNEESVLNRFMQAFESTGIKSFQSFIIDNRGWEGENIPGGWAWDDIGNYYGAGASALNWRENQYDLILKSGSEIGSHVEISGTKPVLYNYKIESKARAAAKGTGDNAYIYFPLNSSSAVVRGTIPVGESRFVISGAMPSGAHQFIVTILESLAKKGIDSESLIQEADRFTMNTLPAEVKILHTEISPSLDSISYWFLRRSINLYGEALIKTIAFKKEETATTDNGASLVRDHWVNRNIGIAKSELNLHDGSGLSPLNRTTTHAQVAILNYARKQPWFDGYFSGFPEYNNMKMKSGTISGVKGFCGYHKSGSGKEYIFSMLVNNYNGSASALVKKMYRVLDELK